MARRSEEPSWAPAVLVVLLVAVGDQDPGDDRLRALADATRLPGCDTVAGTHRRPLLI